MATNTNNVKFLTNLIRSRFSTFLNITEVYKPTLTRNNEKIMNLIKEKTAQASKSELVKKIRVAKEYYRLEMAPPTANEMQKLQADLALVKEFIQSGCYKFLTVKQAWLLFLVGTEVALWFYLGETIGKMHIVGYKV
ncbi:ATP synthase subunit g, mitochondrial-like [Galleria mellonella]|uniref:ATP synthase subunit g, mitochondrial-like n=1 Tax=Galleria mellonella TaxID=7137 RepID=A0A6J1X5D1_GALME|nr:ATP synthase subunit g, mitochondrial-like [Galleria mellonella]